MILIVRELMYSCILIIDLSSIMSGYYIYMYFYYLMNVLICFVGFLM